MEGMAQCRDNPMAFVRTKPSMLNKLIALEEKFKVMEQENRDLKKRIDDLEQKLEHR